MIAKHVSMQTASKSDFAGLVKYLIGMQDKNERVGTIRTTNCQSERAETAILEAINTQAQNKRSAADKTYHLIISFPPGESPEEEVLATIEQRICASIGFAAHQRVSVVHHDTDSLHVHVAINKIHPTRYTIHEPFNDYYTLGQICTKLEKEFGLQQVNHTAAKAVGENRAADMEKHADVESLLGWIKRECVEEIAAAQTWAELHAVMRAHGLAIHERANGLVITADNDVSVKASSVCREFSKPNLEKRLGAFESASSRATEKRHGKKYEKKPMPSRFNTVELHARYKRAQQEAIESRSEEWAKAIARKDRLIEAAKRTGRLKRAAIKLVRASALAKKFMYAATSKALREEIATIINNHRTERQRIHAKHGRQAWADWLRSEATAGDKEALEALRARRGKSQKGDSIRGTGGQTHSRFDPSPDSITKNGTVIYRFGASAVRDDGDRLSVSCGASNAGLEAALRMAMDRYGSNIAVNGSIAFQEQVVRVAAAAKLEVSFDNTVLKRHHKNLLHQHSKKENNHGNKNGSAAVDRRPGGCSDRRGRTVAARRAAARAAAKPVKPKGGDSVGVQPHTRVSGQKAPPASRNGLRELPQLGVVHITHGGEVLLPRDVSGHVEHQRTKPAHRVRRHFPGPGLLKSIESDLPLNQDNKPNIGRLGMAPPPASKDRLRRLGQLGTMTADRPEPAVKGVVGSNVPKPPRNRALLDQINRCRPIDRKPPKAVIASLNALHAQKAAVQAAPARPPSPRVVAPLTPNLAADKYIFEREQKRINGFEIPKHARYTFLKDVSAKYAGTRHVDGQALALLKVGEEILVLPVDEATARRLKRIVLGQPVDASAKGIIKTKGRSR